MSAPDPKLVEAVAHVINEEGGSAAYAAIAAERDAAIGELADIANRTYGAEGIHQRNYVAERDLKLARDEIERFADLLDQSEEACEAARASAKEAALAASEYASEALDLRKGHEMAVLLARAEAKREIDAARAEVAALRERWLKWATVHACCEAGLVASPDPCPWHPNGRLADLRAKVEVWRAEASAEQDRFRDRAWQGGPLEDRDIAAIEAYDNAGVQLWAYQRFIDAIEEVSRG